MKQLGHWWILAWKPQEDNFSFGFVGMSSPSPKCSLLFLANHWILASWRKLGRFCRAWDTLVCLLHSNEVVQHQFRRSRRCFCHFFELLFWFPFYQLKCDVIPLSMKLLLLGLCWIIMGCQNFNFTWSIASEASIIWWWHSQQIEDRKAWDHR